MTCNFRTIIADTAPETLGTASMFNCLFDLLRLHRIRVPDPAPGTSVRIEAIYFWFVTKYYCFPVL